MPTSHISPSWPFRSRRAFRVCATATIVCALLGAGVAAAQVGSAWTEFQGGPAKTGATADGPAPGYRQAWRAPIEPGGPGDRFGLSAPVIAGDIVAAVGPEQILGIDVSSGEQAFEIERDLGPSVPAAVTTAGDATAIVYTEGWGDRPPSGSPTAETDSTPSPSQSPSAGEGPPADPVDSHLAAFDLATKEPLWPPVQLDEVSRTGVTVAGDSALVGVNDGTVTAIELSGGSVTWRRALDAPLVTPLAASDGLVLVSLQGDRDTQPVVVALDAASGEERWRYEPTALSAVVSAVSVDGASAFAIFAGLSETSVVAIDMGDGSQRWTRRVDSAFDGVAPPVLSSGKVFVTDVSGHARALDAGTGEELWDFALNAPVFRCVPVLVGDHLLVPTLEGELGAIDVETGELVWRRPADGASMRALAPTEGVLVAVRGGADAGIEAFEHDPDAALVREASPTTLVLGRMLGAMAIAAVPLLVLVLLLGRALPPRMGPAFPAADANADPDDAMALGDEPLRDPWEDEDPTP